MTLGGSRSMAAVRAALLIALAGVGWGLLAPVQKLLYGYRGGTVFDAYTFVVARAAWTAALLLTLVVALWIIEQPRVERRDWPYFATLWACNGFGLFSLYAIATQLTSVAHVVFIVGLAPPTTAVLEAVIFRKRLDGVRRIAIGCGAFGVVLLAFGRSAAGSSAAGDALMLAWLLVYATNTLGTRALLARYSPQLVASLGTGGGALALAVVGIALGYGGAAFRVSDAPGVALGMLGVCVLWTGIIAPLAFAGAIRLANAALASAGSQYLATAVGIVFSVAVLHEAWTLTTALAGALMVVSLGLTFAPTSAGQPSDA